MVSEFYGFTCSYSSNIFNSSWVIGYWIAISSNEGSWNTTKGGTFFFWLFFPKIFEGLQTIPDQLRLLHLQIHHHHLLRHCCSHCLRQPEFSPASWGKLFPFSVTFRCRKFLYLLKGISQQSLSNNRCPEFHVPVSTFAKNFQLIMVVKFHRVSCFLWSHSQCVPSRISLLLQYCLEYCTHSSLPSKLFLGCRQLSQFPQFDSLWDSQSNLTGLFSGKQMFPA